MFILLMEILGLGNFFLEMFDKSQEKMIETGRGGFLINSSKNFQRTSDNLETKTTLLPEDSKKPLKLSKEELGRHTWALLHSYASSFPLIPSEEDKKTAENFLVTLASIYPCKVCGKHFKEMLQNFPVKCSSREEFAFYLCDLHNKVNIRLGKPEYDCRKTFEIWGGDCGCNLEN